MGSPLQLTVDLNDIVKKLVETAKDARDFSRDSSDIGTCFRRELGRTEFYDSIIKRKVLKGSGTIIDAVGDLQRASLIESVQDVHRGWEDFVSVIEQPYRLAPSATWPGNAGTIGNDESPVQSRSGSLRGLSWAFKGKSKAKRILDQIHMSNEFLRNSIEDICRYFDQLDPQALSSLAEFSKSIDTSQAGLDTHITRLTIQRGRKPSNMKLLREKGFIDSLSDTVFGPESDLRQGQVSGYKPVLVECIPSEDFLPMAIDRAVRLAMLLNQPEVDGLGILPCLGLYQNKNERRLEFIFDLTGPRMDMARDGITITAEIALQAFHSLLSQLQRSDRNGDPGILRYYKITEVAFKPLSINQRVKLARSLAGTIQHLHHAEWVHGNITSNNIYFFHERKKNQSGLSLVQVKNTYLFGFQYTRLKDEYSDQRMWINVRPRDNLYRHPDRQIFQGESGPASPHTPLHDIYSLGVVLLEIGLGRSADWLVRQMPQISDDVAGHERDVRTITRSARSAFITLAENYLPEKMGDSYATLTRMCLNGNLNKLEDGDGAETELSLSTAFRSRVIEPLDRLLNSI